MARLAADIARGWTAPVGRLVTGGLAALAISTPTLAVLNLAGLDPGAAAAVGAVLQLGATYWIAGRLERSNQE